MIVSPDKKLAHRVKIILNDGSHQESAAELFLAMALLLLQQVCVSMYTQGMELAQDT